MEQQERDQFLGLKNRVLNTFKVGFRQTDSDARRLQLLEMPSFSTWTSFELYDRQAEGDFLSSSLLVLAIWRAEIDVEKFHDPVTRLRSPTVVEPTIEVFARSLDRLIPERMLSELSNLHIESLQPGRSLMLDGTAYELTVDRGSRLLYRRWHEGWGMEWKPIQNWAQHWIAGLRQLAKEV